MKIKRNFKMGNVLCKNKKTQPHSTTTTSTTTTSKNPIDGIIGRCTQICPHSIGKKKHFWDKQVLETSPPCRQQPKANDSGWNSVSLTVPDSPDYHPVPPPRKKRVPNHSIKNELTDTKDISPEKSLISSEKKEKEEEHDNKQPIVENKVTVDEVQKTEESNLIEKLSKVNLKMDDIEISSDTVKRSAENEKDKQISTTRGILKIGNRKSDKFFGENLSESLSDKPLIENADSEETKGLLNNKNDHEMTKTEISDSNKTKDQINEDKDIKAEQSKDEIDHQITKIESVEDSEEMVYQINKEKGKLLFSIQNQFPEKISEDLDPNAVPVEEEIIVPVKRITPHICDNDTLIHNILHKPSLASDAIPPKKPQRDFSKYKKPLENTKSDETTITSESSHNTIENTNNFESDKTLKSQPQASTSEEELHSEAETLPLEESPEKSPPPRSTKQKIHRSSDIAPPSANLTRSEKILRRCLSSQSYLPSDLIEAIATQANNLSPMSPDGYLPEDYVASSNDGTSNFSPNSKLTEKRRKISQQSVDEISSETANKAEANEESSSKEIKMEHKLKLNSDDKEDYLPNYEEATGIPRHTLNSSVTATMAETLEEPKKILLPIDPNFHRRISSTKEISNAIKSFITKDDLDPKEVLKSLEEEFGEILNFSCLSSEDQELIKKLRNNAESAPVIDVSSSKEEYSLESETPQSKETDEISKTDVSSFNESSMIAAKIENQIDLKSPGMINKALEAVKSGEKRRHSIDDLDSWFSSPDSSNHKDEKDKENYDKIKCRKREISLPNAFDGSTTTITSTITMTTDKIDNSSKENDKKDEKSKDETVVKKNISTEIFLISKNDHSPLLKFLESEKTNCSYK